MSATAAPPADATDGDVTSARPPLPPFTPETATQKVRTAENTWNTRDAERVAEACTEVCVVLRA